MLVKFQKKILENNFLATLLVKDIPNSHESLSEVF